MGGIHDYQIELVLIEYDIPATCWLKERSIKVTICQQHCQSCCKYRQTSNQLNTNKTNRPYKQRYTVQSHTLCTHVCYCYQKVNTTLNRPNTRHMKTKNCLVNRCSGMAQCTTERGICCPTHSRSLFYQCTNYLQSLSHGLNPKTNVVHSRKCHVGSSDHYGHQPVTKPTHQCRHYYKELHQQSVCSNLQQGLAKDYPKFLFLGFNNYPQNRT